MKLSLLLIGLGAFLAPAQAQTVTVYLRDSGPAAVPICGATNATPVVVETCAPHGLSVGNAVTIQGVATGTGVSPVNGLRVVIASGSNDATHFAIGDLSSTPVAGTGAWFNGTAAGSINSIGAPQWVGKVSAYTTPAGPIGWLDGTNGVHTRQLATTTLNGMTSLVVSGGNLATVTLSYNHGLVNGNKIGIWGSGVSALDNSHAPYVVTVTGAQTFTFPVSGVSNGTKTGVNNACGPAGTPNDTIGGTQDCLVVSQLAWTGNPAWDGLQTALGVTNMLTGTGYKNVFHGGLAISGFQSPGWYANVALAFYVDRSNQHLFDAGFYDFVWPELNSNVNWIGNQFFGSAGNNFTSDFLSHNMNGFAMVYSIFAPYAASATKATTLGKILNDSDDPGVTPCVASGDVGINHNDLLASGVSQAGTGSSITLAAGDSAPNHFYEGNVVYLGPVSLGSGWGRITNYDSSSKIAQVSVNDHWLPPTVGTAYSIYATVTIGSQARSNTTTGGVVTTLTGINTHFSTKVVIGDTLEGENDWDSVPDSSSSYVCGGPGGCGSPISSDTSLTVINSWLPATSTTVPSLVWYFPHWVTGDCGMIHRNKYWVGSPMSQPAVYPSGGTLLAAVTGGPLSVRTLSTDGGNNTATWAAGHLVLDLAMAVDDPRAVRDLAGAHSFGFDYELRHYMNYGGGPLHSGTAYSYGNTQRGVFQFAQQTALVFPSFPSQDLTGPWVNQASIYKMYAWYPDKWYSGNNGILQGSRYATETDNNTSSYTGRYLTITGMTLDPVFTWSPTSANAQYFRNFLENAQPGSGSLWGYQGVSDDYQYANVLSSDPRIGSLDWRAQPLQYAFKASSATVCHSLTGWPCPPLFRGDAVISRGPWSTLSSTWMYFGARSWWGDHDNAENGTLRITKASELMMTDYYPLGGQAATGNPDQTVMGDMMQFGGANSTRGGIFTQYSAVSGTATAGISPITRWASANHGSWDPAYGDQNSQYAYVCADLAGAYNTPLIVAQRCVAHFKLSGSDEFFAQHDIAVPVSSIPIVTHIHYTQNGDPGNAFSLPEGNTTCPGAGGCPALDTNRVIQELEDGGTNGVTTRNYGIISNFLSPGTITLQDDSAAATVAVSSVRKTATFTISSFVTGVGFITTINTSSPHSLISGEVVMFNGVSGTGCGASNAFNNGVFTWHITVTSATQFTIPFDTHTVCPSPSGGTVTSITLFNAPAHGMVNNVNGVYVRVSAATGQWAVWNQHGMSIIIVDADHFNEYWLSSPDTSSYTTSFDGVIEKFYTGGFGWTHRISINAGPTPGAAVSSFEAVVIHKVAQNLFDTSLTTVALNPDSNWTGAQMCGALSCGVYLGARGGTCHSAVTNFSTTTRSSTAQYIIGGLCAGTWAITIAGTPVSGSPFTVSEGDGSVEFVSTTDGTVSFTPSGLTAPALVLTSSALPFTCVSGGSGGSSPLGISGTGSPLTNWTGSSNQSWATLSVGSGSGPGNTLVQVDCSGVSPGTYSATVSVASTTGGITNSPQTVALSLTATGGSGVPALTASPTSLSFFCNAGSGNPASQALAIGAINTTLTNWSVTATQSWLGLSPASDTGPSSTTVSIDCSGLTVGTYTDTISIASSTGGITNSPLGVPVTLNVTIGATLTASPSSLSFVCLFGGASPASQTVAIGASGVTLTNWSASNSQFWLGLSPPSSSSAGNLTVTATCPGTPVGIHTDIILVTSTTPNLVNIPVPISVTFNVRASGKSSTGKSSSGGIIKQ